MKILDLDGAGKAIVLDVLEDLIQENERLRHEVVELLLAREAARELRPAEQSYLI